MSDYYVKPVTARKQVVGYGVYDRVNGLTSEHAYFPLTIWESPSEVKDAADKKCSELNRKNKIIAKP